MRPKLLNVTLVAAALINIIAQAFIFMPAYFTTISPQLQIQKSPLLGIGVYGLSILAFLLILRSQPFKSGANWILLAISIVAVAGIYYFKQSSASNFGEAGFLFSGAMTTLAIFGIFINKPPQTTERNALIENASAGHEKPSQPIRYIESDSQALNEQITALTRKINAEKHRTTQLTFLNELSQQLESELDSPVAAQLTITMIERAIDCSLVSLMMYEQETKEFVTLAAVGKEANIVPSGYRQNGETGLLGRVARLKKTQLVNDTEIDPDFFPVNNEPTLSEIAVPIMHNGQIKGIIQICADKTFAFSTPDVGLAESAAQELTRAWERSGYHRRLTQLTQAGIFLATLLDPQTAVQEIAALAQKTLEARFVFITLLDLQGNFSRTAYAGEAPNLLNSLNSNSSQEPLLQAAMNATKPFRVRDIRKYTNVKNIEIDHGGLRGALAIPIRLRRLSIGVIIAFGKQNGVFFSENDESLAGLLASQAAASIESSWLYQELRNTLNTTSLLYQLSLDVTQLDDLNKAVGLIAQAARRAANAKEAGIILFSKENTIEAAVEIDGDCFHTRNKHPMPTINQAIQSRQAIILSSEYSSQVCYPLITRDRAIGALWMNIPESRGQNYANIQTLANQAAVTLERTLLLAESRRQAKQIEAAYEQLQATYDQTLSALMSALDARDRETEGHSNRVSRTACMIGEILGLDNQQLKALERGSLLHDIGKIGISDVILHKPGKLTEAEWKIMKTHPSIGAKIVAGIPFLQECMPVVYGHHERWDGSGYPQGLKGKDIHINARIFAVADVFDALTSKRAYRKSSTPDEAIQYLREQVNILFDAEVVETLSQLPYHELIQQPPNSQEKQKSQPLTAANH